MEITQYTWSRQTVVFPGRDGSVSNRLPQWSFYANRIRSDESHCKPGCSQLDVESNEEEEGKKARHKSNITSFQVNNSKF